jgi:hypothetical protein
MQKTVSRSLFAVFVMLVASNAGAVTRDGGVPAPGAPRRPRLIRIVKKIVKGLGDLLSNPRP